ncbi:MAG: tyrosine-type recombinase/integrase [Gorillibacterium sp.]|nr:tyrosine-type recombinase/integrase [Gorillibacterium sp.]
MYYAKRGSQKRPRPTRKRNTPDGPTVGYDIQPIRDIETLLAVQSYLAARNLRDEFLYLMGINSGLRVSDLLWLTVRDVQSGQHVLTRELKTGKVRRFFVNDQLRAIIDDYIKGKHVDDFLFPNNRYGHLPISRHWAYKLLRQAGESVGLQHVGTHTLRKTFGYHHYAAHRDISILMMIFNHREQSDTLNYIGWTQDLIDNTMKGFFLGKKRKG